MRKLLRTSREVTSQEQNIPERSLWCAVLATYRMDLICGKLSQLRAEDYYSLQKLCGILKLDLATVVRGLLAAKPKIKRKHGGGVIARNPKELLDAIEFCRRNPPKFGELKKIAARFNCRYDRLYERLRATKLRGEKPKISLGEKAYYYWRNSGKSKKEAAKDCGVSASVIYMWATKNENRTLGN